MSAMKKWFPLIRPLLLASVLWSVTFRAEWGNFWIKIPLSALSLSSIALVLGPRPEAPRFGVTDILLGLGSAGACILVSGTAVPCHHLARRLVGNHLHRGSDCLSRLKQCVVDGGD